MGRVWIPPHHKSMFRVKKDKKKGKIILSHLIKMGELFWNMQVLVAPIIKENLLELHIWFKYVLLKKLL
jgi:hypothetical protein